jgi:tRNA (mo5U34)-methyltransferase
MGDRITDEKRIRSLMKSVKYWYHQIELAPGVVTPGVNDSQSQLNNLNALGLPSDCSQLRVLDIGCSDGFFSFEMERRGATVVAVDYTRPDVTGFSVASQILGSNVVHIVENVYDLSPEKYGLFDLVLFLGVLYHLRNPMLALDRIRRVTKVDGLLFVESQLATDRTLSSLATPAWQFFPRNSLNNDESTKWAPNLEGLKSAAEEAQFKVSDSSVCGARGYLKAQAVVDSKKEFFRELDSSAGQNNPYWRIQSGIMFGAIRELHGKGRELPEGMTLDDLDEWEALVASRGITQDDLDKWEAYMSSGE